MSNTNTTLREIAADVNLDSSVIMDTEVSSVIETSENNSDVNTANKELHVQARSSHQNRDSSNRGSTQSAINISSQTDLPDMVGERSSQRYSNRTQSYNPQSSWQYRGANRRGRGRGRGHNSRGNNNQYRHSSSKPKKHGHRMNETDRNFLCGNSMTNYNNHINTTQSSSPKNRYSSIL